MFTWGFVRSKVAIDRMAENRALAAHVALQLSVCASVEMKDCGSRMILRARGAKVALQDAMVRGDVVGSR
jgi:hypothetical protein